VLLYFDICNKNLAISVLKVHNDILVYLSIKKILSIFTHTFTRFIPWYTVLIQIKQDSSLLQSIIRHSVNEITRLLILSNILLSYP